MATKKSIVCPTHGSVLVMQKRRSGDVIHSHLSCGCTYETELITADSIVRYIGQLWRVDDIYQGMAVLLNTHAGEIEAPVCELTFIGKDTLTGLGADKIMKDVNDIPSSTGWHDWSPPARVRSAPTYERSKPKKLEKSDSISTAGLIQDEVKRLKKEEKNDNSVRKLRSSAPTSDKKNNEEFQQSTAIPKRRGDW